MGAKKEAVGGIKLQNNKAFWLVYDGSKYDSIEFDSNIECNKKYSLVATIINNKTISSYINGKNVATKDLEAEFKYSNRNVNTLIGAEVTLANDPEKDSYFKGTVYSVRIYNKALTDDEIMQNYRIDKALYNIEDINE